MRFPLFIRDAKMVNQIPTIALVEDNLGHARLIEKNLKRANVSNTILKFTDGQQFVNYLLSNSDNLPLLVLLDLNLPVMDGFQVLKQIKADHQTRKIPVIVLTTTEDPDEISKCYQFGCNVYITKPLEYSEFSDAIRKLGAFLSVVKIPNSLS